MFYMKSHSTQKVLKVGSSIGITIPAKEARYHGIKNGDKVRLIIESKDESTVLTIIKLGWIRRLFRR